MIGADVDEAVAALARELVVVVRLRADGVRVAVVAAAGAAVARACTINLMI